MSQSNQQGEGLPPAETGKAAGVAGGNQNFDLHLLHLTSPSQPWKERSAGSWVDQPGFLGVAWLEAAITETGSGHELGEITKRLSGGQRREQSQDGAPPAPRLQEGASEGDGTREAGRRRGMAPSSPSSQGGTTQSPCAGPGSLGLRPVLPRGGPGDRYTRVPAEGQGQLSS